MELEETSEILNLPSSFYRCSNKCEEFSDLFLPNYRMAVDGSGPLIISVSRAIFLAIFQFKIP